jgi:predicted ATPase/DNA-binding XRE family transcriptional regulator
MHDDGEFGRRLRQLRRARDLTQHALAQAAFCALDTIKKLESGRRRPSRQLAAQLADVLGLDATERHAFLAAARASAASDALDDPPPATTTSPAQRVQSNLPAQLTRFIGREQAIADVGGLLQRARLLTLTGSGGSGKTRLALEVGAAVTPSFADGVWLVELATLADGAMVAETVATIVGLPSSSQPARSVVMQYLRDKRILLLLDNCEHLIQACAELAEALLRGCPGLHILATSREGLGVAGEVVWPVPTLQLPNPAAQLTPAELATFEAVQLFIDRAALVSLGFTLTAANAAAVRQICTRLDGIPLAIELAAARVKTVSVQDIATHLGDRFRLLTGGSRTVLPRHQTLRALIDWSEQLLTDRERIVLRRLAVFASGWTLAAAETVCADDAIDAQDVLDALTRLVDKSLVVLSPRSEARRYTFLETIRQYASERLEDAEESAAVRTRHLDYFLSFSERLAPPLEAIVGSWEDSYLGEQAGPQPDEGGSTDRATFITRLADDLENICRATDWAAETGRIDEGLCMLNACGSLFIIRARQNELLARLRLMLEAQAPRDGHRHVRACLWIVHVYHRQANFEQARVWLDKAELLSAQIENPVLEMGLLHFRIYDAQMRGDYALAHAYLEQQQNLAIAHDYFGMSQAAVEDALINQRGLLLLSEGNYQQARQPLQVGHTRLVKRGNLFGTTALARFLGYALLNIGDLNEAAECFRESLVGNFSHGDKQAVAACLSAWAAYSIVQGDLARAARLFGASEALQEALSTPLVPLDVVQVQRNLATLRQLLSSPELAMHWAAGRAMSLEQAMHDALSSDAFEQKERHGGRL